jgi:hypothetical protein
MHLETTTFERAVHLLLFVVGGIVFAAGALAILERVTGDSAERAIRWVYVAVAGAAFAVLVVIEVMFHVMR